MRRFLFAAVGFVSVAACGAFDGANDNAKLAPTTPDGGDGGVGSSGTLAEGGLAGEGGTEHIDAGADDFPAAVLKLNGLAGYWRLSDGAMPPAKDAAGSSDGTYQGTVGSVAGLLPGSGNSDAISLGGNGDVKIPVTEKLKTFDKAATIAVLVRPKGTGSTVALVEKDGVFVFLRSFSGVATMQLQTGSGLVSFDSQGAVPVDETVLMIAAYDLTTGDGAIWINRDTTPFTGLKATPTGASSPICIGGMAQGGLFCSVSPFSGVVDEVFLLDRMIEQEEVNLLLSRAKL